MKSKQNAPRHEQEVPIEQLLKGLEETRRTKTLNILTTALKLSKQSELRIAKKAKISPTTISNIRTGANFPTPRVIKALARVLQQEFANY